MSAAVAPVVMHHAELIFFGGGGAWMQTHYAFLTLEIAAGERSAPAAAREKGLDIITQNAMCVPWSFISNCLSRHINSDFLISCRLLFFTALPTLEIHPKDTYNILASELRALSYQSPMYTLPTISPNFVWYFIEIWHSHGDKNVDVGLLDCNRVGFRPEDRGIMFLRNVAV